MANKRHVEYSTEELEAKKMLLTPAATKRANINAAKSLRDFLRQKRQAVNFEDFTPEQLNEVLGHFYMSVRTEKNELYRGKSLQALMYGLNRYLSYPPHNKPFNIMTGSQFHSSNELFKVAMQELKAEGNADVKHTPAINQEDLKTLYASKFMSPNTPTGLLNKVQFDVRFYFFRRGLENFEKMTKDTFGVKIDQTTGKQYVIKRFDELTKNHRAGDEELVTGVMPETGDSSCPVYSYNKYLSLLNPKCERLWQFPINTFHGDDETWYDNRPMGVHTMKKFMAKLSELCQLSQMHTNHSVRATGATLLADKNFSPIDIISVTGHKTVNSLQP
ncbi:hypothetical protein V1264_006191 [Littorina saxatilis]|uniref:KCTD1_15 n=1 Tax=Littorina saxatilis TaxID=31220 RepID=A0AAN9AWY8_9CAEN